MMIHLPLTQPYRRGPWRGDIPTPGKDETGRFGLGRRSATILAVDDEPEALDVLRALFMVEGYDFIQAADCAQALALITERQPDLLIVDYMMPGMSGLELCEYLRAEAATADIPIIMYSAYTIPDRYWQKGLYERSFTKPADHEELLREVHSLLTGA
jgi:two-component system, OmpR family, phosphate regulon response regulator PhoB